MIPQKRFKLTRQAVLLATISAAFPVTGYCAAAGFVEFEVGNVESVAANGARHPLYKGSEINAGEAISTAANGRAQVRFADGGYISLQPSSLFRVDDFNYKGKVDGEEKGFFSLLKGGFRAITGVIGHVNNKNYRVRTPAATLGIRGTGYNMVLRDDGLFVNVGEGAISLHNNAGFLVVTAGGAAFVADFNTPPKPTNEQPSTPPPGLKEPEFTVADQRTSTGSPTVLQAIPINLVSGANYTMAYAYTGTALAGGAVFGAVGLSAPVVTTFNGTSQLLSYSNSGATDTGTLGTGTVTFSATDGIIGWGRWTGTFATTPTTGLTTPTFDYVVGIPTASMPTTGTANYILLGNTTPTAWNGTSGYNFTGTLAANFATSSVGVNMTVANVTGSLVVSGTAPIIGSTFAATTATGLTTTGSGTILCSGACNTSINGFFAGTNAVRAGLSYSIANISVIQNIQGVAVFTQ